MIKHISPAYNPSNGVSVYGSAIDTLLQDITVHTTITHLEIGNGGYEELWQGFALRRRPRSHKLVLTLHDPPVVVAKPFAKYLPSVNPVVKTLRKALDLTVGRLVVWSVIRSANAVIILNPLAADPLVTRFGIPKNRIHYSPLLPQILVARNVSRKQSGILFFGNLAQHKGIDTLLSAYKHSGLDRLDTPLTIVGAWGDNAAYRRKVEQLAGGLQHVRFLGRLSDQDLAQQIQAAQLVVLPYIDPGIIHASGPLISVMAAGKAVVASDIPIFSGYLEDRKTGILVPAGDANELAVALAKLTADPKLCEQLGAEAKHYVETHITAKRITSDLKKVYISL